MKKIIQLIIALVAVLQLTVLDTASAQVDGYTLKTIAGRTVYVQDTAFAIDEQRTEEALDLLKEKLQEIDKMDMSKKAKDALKKVKFFVDWSKRSNGAAEYHPSKQWLKNNGWRPEKAKTVNITNINNFIEWTSSNQPYMVLHELSHAYHDQVLGYGNKQIKAAYDAAMAAKKYESVDYYSGSSTSKKKAYATNNEKEYFAELTEAYYGKNDFYPFKKAEIGVHDPQAYTMLRKAWQNSVYDPNKVSFDPNKFYRLTTKFQGPEKSLDVVNDDKDDKLLLMKTGNFTGQKWKIEKLEDGYYRLTTKFQGEGKSLDVVNDDKDNKLLLTKTGNFTGQKWRIEKLNNGYYRLTTKFQGEGKSLDIVNDAKDDKLELATTGRYTGQYWRITPVK